MTRSEIENTDAFKSLPVFKQNIYKTHGNIRNLCEQYIIAKNCGYEEWYLDYLPNDSENKIIKELLKV